MGSLRWRRYRHLLALVALIGLILVVVFGDVRIAAITSSERTAADAEVTQDIGGTVDLFDDSVVHEIRVRFDPAEYDNLIQTYREQGEKEYIEAGVTIDGTTIDQVGIRLKGNSTLMGLREDGPISGGRERMQPPPECVEGGGQAAPQPNGTPVAGATPGADTPEAAADAGGFGGGGPGFGGNISADDPSSLPWLISFDEYVEGRRYQGQSEIAVRPVLGSKSSLNEAVALQMVGAAGEPTQQASYSSFSMNGSEEELRLIVESPGDTFGERNFAADGVLYKALATGSFEYLGDDPTLYETSFDQETAKNHQDLKPLIELVKWVSEASDEEFVAELDQHVEVESLARYIALQELLDNFDDMAGPGKNYYLWYDLETEKFTVLTWDLNLALSEFGGPGGRGPGGGAGDEEAIDFDAMMSCLDRERGEGGDGGRGGGMRMGHPLKERFLAAPAFQELYAREYAAIYEALYGNGQAVGELDRLASVVAASSLVEESTIETEAAALRTKLETQSDTGPAPTVGEPAAIPGTPAVATPSR
jgi:spore coat protein CotH